MKLATVKFTPRLEGSWSEVCSRLECSSRETASPLKAVEENLKPWILAKEKFAPDWKVASEDCD